MIIDRMVIECVIIFAYKHERFELVQELLDLLSLFSDGHKFELERKPVLVIVKK